MLYGLHYRHNCKMDREYYAFFALESSGNYLAERLYAADGQLLAAPPNQPVTRAVFDSPAACPSCRVYSEGPLNAYATRTAIDTFVYYDEGIGQTVVHPVVVFNFGGSGTVKWQYFDGTGWQSPACDALPSLPGGGGPQLPFEVTAHSGALELYVTGYGWGFKQPRILKWRLPSGADGCHGGAWEPADVIWGMGELPGISFFNFVQDAKADGSLTATFFEMNTTSIDHPNAVGKLYGWGNVGAVKASGYAQDMTSPVGPAVHFDPLAQSNPEREDDNIRIGHTSAFAFTSNQIAVEAVVQFDGSNGPNRDEFVLGKHSPLIMDRSFGFNLWYDYAVHNLRWDIGDGFNDLSLAPGTVLTGTWHYVVGTLDTAIGHEQALWIDGVECSQATGSFVPNWDGGGGPWDLRLGARAEGVSGQNDTLDGALGYVAIRNSVPSDAYIRASWRNMIVGNFVVYCPRQQPGQGEPPCQG